MYETTKVRNNEIANNEGAMQNNKRAMRNNERVMRKKETAKQRDYETTKGRCETTKRRCETAKVRNSESAKLYERAMRKSEILNSEKAKVRGGPIQTPYMFVVCY